MDSSTPRPHFNSGKDSVPILQEVGWAPGPVWTGGKSRPHRDSILDRPTRSSVAIPTELPGPQNSVRYHHKRIPVYVESTSYSSQILIKLELFRRTFIFEKYSTVNFHENPSSRSRDVPCGRAGGGRTDGRTGRHD